MFERIANGFFTVAFFGLIAYLIVGLVDTFIRCYFIY